MGRLSSWKLAGTLGSLVIKSESSRCGFKLQLCLS